jgi:hypothetical protein
MCVPLFAWPGRLLAGVGFTEARGLLKQVAVSDCCPVCSCVCARASQHQGTIHVNGSCLVAFGVVHPVGVCSEHICIATTCVCLASCVVVPWDFHGRSDSGMFNTCLYGGSITYNTNITYNTRIFMGILVLVVRFNRAGPGVRFLRCCMGHSSHCVLSRVFADVLRAWACVCGPVMQ